MIVGSKLSYSSFIQTNPRIVDTNCSPSRLILLSLQGGQTPIFSLKPKTNTNRRASPAASTSLAYLPRPSYAPLRRHVGGRVALKLSRYENMRPVASIIFFRPRGRSRSQYPSCALSHGALDRLIRAPPQRCCTVISQLKIGTRASWQLPLFSNRYCCNYT